MKYCSQCGASNRDDAAFCTKCGGSFASESLTALQTVTVVPSVGAQGTTTWTSPTGERFIGQWNWGAALLYPFWLMTHRRAPLGILWFIIGLIPFLNVVGIIAFFYFGLRGNRIAVRSGRFTDETTFVAVQNAWRNWGFGVIAVSIVIGVASSLARNTGNGSYATGAYAAPSAAADTSAPDTAEEVSPKPEYLSNGSTVGGLRYTITDVSRQSSVESFGEDKQAAGEFLVVKVSVANVGSKGADISASDFHLKKAGTEYDEDTSVTVEGEFFLEKLNPGTTKSGTLVFDVPAGTAPDTYALEVYGNGSEGSQETGLIKL